MRSTCDRSPKPVERSGGSRRTAVINPCGRAIATNCFIEQERAATIASWLFLIALKEIPPRPKSRVHGRTKPLFLATGHGHSTFIPTGSDSQSHSRQARWRGPDETRSSSSSTSSKNSAASRRRKGDNYAEEGRCAIIDY